MHVGDILHLRLGELMVAGLVRELEHVERHAPHTGLRQRVQPGDVRALVVDLRQGEGFITRNIENGESAFNSYSCLKS